MRQSSWAPIVERVEMGTEVVFGSTSLEGMSSNEAGWLRMTGKYGEHLQLILSRVTEDDWKVQGTSSTDSHYRRTLRRKPRGDVCTKQQW